MGNVCNLAGVRNILALAHWVPLRVKPGTTKGRADHG
jgi:hypothetical protein